MPLPKPCLDCSELTTNGTRCIPCSRAQERRRNQQPHRAMYRDPVYKSYVKASSCAKCGAVDDLTVDHIIAIKQGGTNDPSNYQTLCRSCNSSKGSRGN